MISRQFILDSLNHIETNRIPVDFGSTAVTGIHAKCINDILEYYGIKNEPVKVVEPYQMLGEINDELASIIGIDTAPVGPYKTMFGFRNENWKEWQMPQGLVVQVPEHFITKSDEQGDELIFPGGDMTAEPSGRMAKNGWFFDTIIRQKPIVEQELDPEDNLEEFKTITEEELDQYEYEARRAREKNKASVATFGGTALGDIALVPAPFLKDPKGIRDIEEWYVSTIVRTDYLHSIFEKQCEIAINNLIKLNERLGELIDVIFVCGTDFGTQSSTFCSVPQFRDLYMPYYKKINDWIHKNTEWKTMKHSCGAVESLIPSFIESGFDVLNPVQISAKGMDPQKLKGEYGRDISFWGGGIDTQNTLAFSKPNDVYDEVKKNCEILSKSGGFVFNSVHNIQANVPLENILSMIKALKDF